MTHIDTLEDLVAIMDEIIRRRLFLVHRGRHERAERHCGIRSGYSGEILLIDLQQICSKKTGHAEVVRIAFNPDEVKLRDIFRYSSPFMTRHNSMAGK